jgi:hypothetical protein
VRVRFWVFAAGGLVALLFAYAGGRIGTHQWCGGPEGGPVDCEYSNGHHGVYLALGWVFFALAVSLFVLAWRAKKRSERAAVESTT